MTSTEPIISKRGAAVTIMDIKLTIPETPEIKGKPVSATSQSVIMAA